MAKLTRKTQKIFAEDSTSVQVTAFGTAQNTLVGDPATFTKDPDEIQTNEWSTGWHSAITGDYAPYREDRNAIDLVTTRQLAYLFETGTPEYDPDTNYCLGAECKKIENDGNYKIYASLVADNLGNSLDDIVYWKKVFERDGTFVTLDTEQVITSKKTFNTGGLTPVNAYTNWSIDNPPSSGYAGGGVVGLKDANGLDVGNVSAYRNTNTVKVRLHARNVRGNSNAYIDVNAFDDGSSTFSFFPNIFSTSGTGYATWSKGQTSIIEYQNGFKIFIMKRMAIASGGSIITLPKLMSSTNYVAIGNLTDGGVDNIICMNYSKATSNVGIALKTGGNHNYGGYADLIIMGY